MSDELVSFALFSDRLSYDGEKMVIVQRMDIDGGSRLIRGDYAKISSDVTLEAFASQRTLKMFSVLDTKDSFLKLPPETCGDNVDYLQSKKCIRNLREVNDTVERSVKLFEDYNMILTMNEENNFHFMSLNRIERSFLLKHPKKS